MTTLLPPNVKVHLALGFIDMRKGIDGLAMLVQGVLCQDPFTGHLFVFRVDPRRAPKRIGDAHPADKFAYLRWYSWPTTTAPRLPAPIRSEAGAVPFYDGLRLHNGQRV
jgi:transposase